MSLVLLTPQVVDAIHDRVLNPEEIAGHKGDKSPGGALARVDHRLAYGMIEDAFDLAAAYAVAIATGHLFNDGNERTAYESMVVALQLNGIALRPDVDQIGPLIVEVAQGWVEAPGLAAWRRGKAG